MSVMLEIGWRMYAFRKRRSLVPFPCSLLALLVIVAAARGAATAPATTQAAEMKATLVTLHLHDAPAVEAFDQLFEQAGLARPSAASNPTALRGVKVSMDV